MPNPSFLCVEIGPSKRTLFVPAWAENLSVPATTVRVQRRLFLFLLARARQAFLNLRPLACCVNTKLTLAGTLRLNEKVVPRGAALRLREKLANRLPSRQVRLDWATFVSTGGVGVTVVADAETSGCGPH